MLFMVVFLLFLRIACQVLGSTAFCEIMCIEVYLLFFIMRVDIPELLHHERRADAKVGYKSSDRANGEGTTRESKKIQLVTRCVVLDQEVVSLADILGKTSTRTTLFAESAQ